MWKILIFIFTPIPAICLIVKTLTEVCSSLKKKFDFYQTYQYSENRVLIS